MTRNDIIKLAREAGMLDFSEPSDSDLLLGELERFVALVAAAEREACAVTAWSVGMDCHNKALGLPCDARNVGSLAAQAIRARGRI